MMRCTSCGEDVQEAAAMPMAVGNPQVVLTGASRWHVRYVAGVLPAGPETSELHSGPVICGPLEVGGS